MIIVYWRYSANVDIVISWCQHDMILMYKMRVILMMQSSHITLTRERTVIGSEIGSWPIQVDWTRLESAVITTPIANHRCNKIHERRRIPSGSDFKVQRQSSSHRLLQSKWSTSIAVNPQ